MKKKIVALALIASLLLLPKIMSAYEADTYLSKEIQGYCIEIGEMYGVCPELLMAMIETESSGRTDAKNGDCIGLMQVSLRYHSDRMGKLGVADLYDSYGNILVGTDYLVELFEKHHDGALALMIYNGQSNALELYEKGELTNYAEKVLDRSAELERLHEK